MAGRDRWNSSRPKVLVVVVVVRGCVPVLPAGHTMLMLHAQGTQPIDDARPRPFRSRPQYRRRKFYVRTRPAAAASAVD